MADKITILETLGPKLTKMYVRHEGEDVTIPYEDAASFKVSSFDANSLREVADKLGKLHKNVKKCFIRGKFIGEDKAQPGYSKGTWTRTNANFDDQPLHWFMIDIDGFKPNWSHPVETVASSVVEYIEAVLPPCFKGASFYWHLSSSAGMPGKEDFLKCHVHFWSKTPYTSAQMKVWAKGTSKLIDAAVYSRVQVHYTADPVFEDGRVDPVKVRAGWHQGEHDEVDLVIGEEVLAQAHTAGSGTGGNDTKLKDPSEKEGLIGLFHNTFDAEDALLTLLDEFEQVSQRRYTWLEGGGTPEGVWVHDDGMHIGSSHNTWPLDGIANLWDVVRVFKFGKLDHHTDPFEQLNIDSLPVGARPSDKAMYEWADQLPEIKAARKEEREGPFARCKALLEEATDSYDLEFAATQVARSEQLPDADRVRLTKLLQDRFFALTQTKMPVAMARGWLQTHVQRGISADAPSWAVPWYWITSRDSFVHFDTKEEVSITSFNAMFDREMAQFAMDGKIPVASEMALKTWNVGIRNDLMYNPLEGPLFEHDGRLYINTYRHDLVPFAPPSLSKGDKHAIAVVEDHLMLLLPDERERTLFLDWLSFCVQSPGRKIRWSPLLIGMPGDGKSAFLTMMRKVLGTKNVRILNNKTLESSFTGWATGQCLIGIEELKMHSHNRHDIFNGIKDIISNTDIEIHPKGKDPYNIPNFSNVLALSNFLDAAPATDEDRRLFFIKTAFVNRTADDLAEGIKAMGKDPERYWDDLFDKALTHHIAGLRRWLLDRKLSAEFNPNGRAPITSTRDLAIDLSRSDFEGELDAILAEGALGVYPTLVSTSHLSRAIARKNDHVSPMRGRALRLLLLTRGWEPYPKDSVRWGENGVCTWYFKGEFPEHPGRVADALENERLMLEVGRDFAD